MTVKIVAAQQVSKFVIEYANQLKSLWLEFDHYSVLMMHLKEFTE